MLSYIQYSRRLTWLPDRKKDEQTGRHTHDTVHDSSFQPEWFMGKFTVRVGIKHTQYRQLIFLCSLPSWSINDNNAQSLVIIILWRGYIENITYDSSSLSHRYWKILQSILNCNKQLFMCYWNLPTCIIKQLTTCSYIIIMDKFSASAA